MIKTKQVFLDDEEIARIEEDFMGYTATKEIAEAGAKAQLKKVTEWGLEPCNGHFEGCQSIELLKRECSKCWQSLLKEIEDKP